MYTLCKQRQPPTAYICCYDFHKHPSRPLLTYLTSCLNENAMPLRADRTPLHSKLYCTVDVHIHEAFLFYTLFLNATSRNVYGASVMATISNP
jgi:hypothetical protein